MTHDMPAWGSPEPEPQQPVVSHPSPGRGLTCPVCSGVSFTEEEGKIETRWGMSKHVLTMKVCQGCGHVLFFYQAGGQF